MKIIKTHAATGSAGNGFGAHKACWAVEGRMDIRVYREIGLWFASMPQGDGTRMKFCAESRRELQAQLAGYAGGAA